MHSSGEGQQPQFVLSLDVGTTAMRSHVYDRHGCVKGFSSKKLEIQHPHPGWCEMDPHKLFDDACSVLKDSIAAAGLQSNQVTCLGIATQRNTFVTWNRKTGETFHNLITWQDLRSSNEVLAWNNSYTLKAMNSGARFLHFFTRQNRHKAASVLKFMSTQVTMRLVWVLANVPNNNVSLRMLVEKSGILCELTQLRKEAVPFNCYTSLISMTMPSHASFTWTKGQWNSYTCKQPRNMFYFGNQSGREFLKKITQKDIAIDITHAPKSCSVMLRQHAFEGNLVFGCIETWLLWKLTNGKIHATDYSCASATGIFDPFMVEWSSLVCGLLNIPMSILPEVRDTSGDFGVTDVSVFGAAIPIRSIVADQQGAMFGQCCFDVGDVKCTMGTGTFVDLNTGKTPHASVAGLYPLVAWKIGHEITYIAEGHSSDTGNVLEWAHSVGLFENVNETGSTAKTVPDSGGVCFVPAFSGLQAPINDDSASTMMIGLNLETKNAHIIRAILESLAFRFKVLYETLLIETKIPLSHIRVNGGVCTNDFLVQLMADIVNQSMERSTYPDMTSLGAAFLAGLASGVWESKDELRTMQKSDRVFHPHPTWPAIRQSFRLWERAVARSKYWYI